MMVPQPTAQYGQVERVSEARAIFSSRISARAGCTLKPKAAAAAPPTAAIFRKSLRLVSTGTTSRECFYQGSMLLHVPLDTHDGQKLHFSWKFAEGMAVQAHYGS
jgi:hypothetical protein